MIEIKDLYKSFGKVDVLKGITETIHEKEIVSIIGPSGSGKSTFLRCINLLEQPTKGSILIDGVDITDPKQNINKITNSFPNGGMDCLNACGKTMCHIVCACVIPKERAASI